MDIPVVVERVIFRNEKGFATLAVNLNPYSSKYSDELEEMVFSKCPKNSYDNFIVTIGMLDSEENPEKKQYVFSGDFFTHPKYGNQFKAEFYYQDEPTTAEGLREYLITLPNIKKVRSLAIIEAFGVEGTIDILNNHPEKLLEINGITEQRLIPIKEEWKKGKEKRELYFWLSSHGIQPKIGRRIYKAWGSDSLEMIQKNPYQLIEIDGFGFPTADNLAHKVMNPLSILYRTKACMQYILLNNLRKNSSLCIPLDDLKNILKEELAECDAMNGITSPIDKHVACVVSCIKDNLDTFVAIKEKKSETTVSGIYVYLKHIWDMEKYIGQQLYSRKHLNKMKQECSEKDLMDSEKDVSEFSKRSIVLDQCQKDAIRSAFENKLTVITGGGGTGKSTICRCIFHLAQEKGLSIRMMSPTGKAAQVLMEKTNCPAATIHRSLKMKPDDNYPKEQIKENIIIVDEVSMVGIDTMFAIMAALSENLWGNLVLIGDANQLPSVSPGNFLSDIMSSGCANVVKLDRIHRQDENSYISVIANSISNGMVVSIPPQANDLRWHETYAEDFEKKIKKAINEYLKKDEELEDLQILSPMYKGLCGVNKINEMVQEIMSDRNNTKENHIYRDGNKFHLYDRVIQIRNDYDKEVFNGDMGKIVALGRMVRNPAQNDKSERYITVNFYGEEKTYFEDEMDDIRLAWCITVHKYQGSQSPNIFFVMSQEANNMMTKELVYTAFTRAEKQLDVYGSSGLLRSAPTKSSIRKRYTNVNKIIRELRENRKLLDVLEEKK